MFWKLCEIVHQPHANYSYTSDEMQKTTQGEKPTLFYISYFPPPLHFHAFMRVDVCEIFFYYPFHFTATIIHTTQNSARIISSLIRVLL